MAKKKNVLFRSKELRDTSSVASLFHDFADKLEQGELVIQRGKEEVTLGIGNKVALKLKVKEKHTKRGLLRKMDIKLSWVEGATYDKVQLK